MRYILTLIVSAVVSLTTAQAHRFYSSLSQIHILEDRKTIQVMHHLAAHDYDDYIYKYVRPILSPVDQGYEDELKQLINEGCYFKFNNKKTPLNWVGYEIDGDKLVVYQEYKAKTPLELITYYNRIMQDYYINYVNHSNVEFMGHTESYISKKHGSVITHKLDL